MGKRAGCSSLKTPSGSRSGRGFSGRRRRWVGIVLADLGQSWVDVEDDDFGGWCVAGGGRRRCGCWTAATPSGLGNVAVPESTFSLGAGLAAGETAAIPATTAPTGSAP
jgi:hypothetical protein